MQTFLKVFGVILAIFVVVGLILPNQVEIKREIEISASKAVIHEYVNNLDNWPKWSPWLELDPSIQTTIGEIHTGVGASQSWLGKSGGGQLTFSDSSTDKGVVYQMSFEGDPTVYQTGLSYQAKGDKTLVAWTMTGEMKPIIIGNYFALLMDSLIGDSFIAGLQKLKEISENSHPD
jgi:hypothetical protein